MSLSIRIRIENRAALRLLLARATKTFVSIALVSVSGCGPSVTEPPGEARPTQTASRSAPADVVASGNNSTASGFVRGSECGDLFSPERFVVVRAEGEPNTFLVDGGGVARASATTPCTAAIVPTSTNHFLCVAAQSDSRTEVVSFELAGQTLIEPRRTVLTGLNVDRLHPGFTPGGNVLASATDTQSGAPVFVVLEATGAVVASTPAWAPEGIAQLGVAWTSGTSFETALAGKKFRYETTGRRISTADRDMPCEGGCDIELGSILSGGSGGTFIAPFARLPGLDHGGWARMSFDSADVVEIARINGDTPDDLTGTVWISGSGGWAHLSRAGMSTEAKIFILENRSEHRRCFSISNVRSAARVPPALP